MITVKNLTYSIPNSGTILNDVTFEIQEGDFIGLLGKNGAGKTTLVDLLMGLRIPSSGEIKILGLDPALSDREVFKDVSFLSQDVWLKDAISVQDFFEFHSEFYPNYSIELQSFINNKFKIDLKAKIGGLSTGQKRRIQIVAALASRPKILFIDEITAVLDPDARKIFFDLLISINQDHKTSIILATNIVEDLKGKVKKVFFIKDHKIDFFNPEEIDSLFLGEE